MLITVNFFYGNVFYIVRRAKLAWLHLGCTLCNLEHFSEFKMAVSSILNFSKYSTFDLDDIEGRVISLFKGFPGRGVHFWRFFWIRCQIQGQIRGQR